ncbi:MAG: nucleotide exchange factor GrpE [Candidatus Acidoferrales bacterium]|nr:nucleotide exchange factor GrpE [Candidatus Acidoferrales bacterium]
MSDHKHKGPGPEPVSPEEVSAQERAAEHDPISAPDDLAKLLAERQELMNTLVRRQADFENYRKRVEKERQQDRHRGVESLVEHILPVLDAFDRALSGSADPAYLDYRKGFELIRRQLWEALAKQGLVRIDALGQEFNPHFHHAIERVETTEHADGIVIGEMQPGYLFHERVLRPAMVRVASAPESKSTHVSKHEH